MGRVESFSELKPCPICRGSKYLAVCTFENEYFYVYCDDCDFGTSESRTQEEAEREWNTRADKRSIVDGLASCPFCGGTVKRKIFHNSTSYQNNRLFYCSSCGARTCGFPKEADKEMVKIWNRGAING